MNIATLSQHCHFLSGTTWTEGSALKEASSTASSHCEDASDMKMKLPALPTKYETDQFEKELIKLYPSVCSLDYSDRRVIRWVLYLYDRKYIFNRDHYGIAETALNYQLAHLCNFSTISMILTSNGRRSENGGGRPRQKTVERLKEIYKKEFLEKGIEFPKLNDLVGKIKRDLPNVGLGAVFYSLPPHVSKKYETPVPEAILQERASYDASEKNGRKRKRE